MTAPRQAPMRRCLAAPLPMLRRALQNSFFKAATGTAFTTVLDGAALMIAHLPKISRLPALVGGLTRVLILARPGMVKMPDFFNSSVAISVMLSSTRLATALCISNALAMHWARALLDMTAVLIDLLLGAIACLLVGQTCVQVSLKP
eukprot:CAMPEP_0175242122 /NCGR_PEP_ID=MMETSP0093-20121207/30906_1 /TAXON_ID=311494 /ORGANISM="Alexandrium monilatum, Strain CCMP3105" /LENGTH=146 /DNA_ID=CAMNT_0016536189 /DNA_START=133 /DNA_END=573 /DNA_ORIENTATION=-